jgi:hypothetical protein
VVEPLHPTLGAGLDLALTLVAECPQLDMATVAANVEIRFSLLGPFSRLSDSFGSSQQTTGGRPPFYFRAAGRQLVPLKEEQRVLRRTRCPRTEPLL